MQNYALLRAHPRAVESIYALPRQFIKTTAKIQISTDSRRTQANQETKALLAKKAEDARKHREQEWQTLLQKNHPGTLSTGLPSVLNAFEPFPSSWLNQNFKWEKEIQAALREADLASTKMPNC